MCKVIKPKRMHTLFFDIDKYRFSFSAAQHKTIICSWYWFCLQYLAIFKLWFMTDAEWIHWMLWLLTIQRITCHLLCRSKIYSLHLILYKISTDFSLMFQIPYVFVKFLKWMAVIMTLNTESTRINNKLQKTRTGI